MKPLFTRASFYNREEVGGLAAAGMRGAFPRNQRYWFLVREVCTVIGDLQREMEILRPPPEDPRSADSLSRPHSMRWVSDLMSWLDRRLG